MRAESRPTSHIGRSLHKNNSLSVIFGTVPPPTLRAQPWEHWGWISRAWGIIFWITRMKID